MKSVNRKKQKNNEAFSRRFRILMGYHDLTLKDIAEYTHNAVSTVGTWKQGRLPTSSETLLRLAEIFQVSTEFLLYGALPPHALPDEADNRPMLREMNALLATIAESELVASNEAREPVPAFRRQPSGSATRHQLEKYFARYLDEAERHPGGLAYTWYRLRHEFPLDFFEAQHPTPTKARK